MISQDDIDAMTPAEMVEEFATTAKQPPSKVMSINLVWEEACEWYDEVLDVEGRHNPVAELKELADLIYVSYGRARDMGYDLEEAVIRVHKNNMGRMKQPDGTIQFREDGKVMKNKDYPKVDLSDLV
jgi:predicted HAD superfamily Cof-like phosphohydrolase